MATDDLVMPFGKFKGQPICDIPSNYLHWLFDEAKDMSDQIADAALAEYKFRTKHNIHFDN